jgi:4-amino-4-deoxy-L-arabinose transferase-like glycosyltransferase
VPDEPAHYNVIRQIAQTGALPKLEPGDYDQDYLGRVVGAGFPPDLALDGVQYQDYQPPLYYLLATPVFILFAGALLPLRLFSLILGAGGVIFAFLAVRELFPLRPLLALTAAGFIAFIPQHIAMLAGVNNDSLSELIIALGLWLILRENNRRLKNGCWWLGVVLGLALLTKVQAYVLVPVFALYIILQWRRARPAHTMDWRGLLRWSLTVFGIGLALGALYWGRNWFVCGPADFVCGNWHNHVVIGQPTTREWITEYGWWGREQSLLPRLFKFTFDSFWGVFGWMGVFMPERIYKILLTFTLLLVIGAAGALRPWRVFSMTERDGLTLLAASALTTCALYLYYNFNFVQHQGRYLFPALIPIALAVALSLEQWDKWLVGLMAYTTRNSKLETRLTSHLPSLLSLLLLASLAFLALYRFIIPALPNWG